MHESLEFAERFEITQTLALYGHLMDEREADRLGEVFAPDGSFDTTSVGGCLYRGLGQLREFVALGDAVHPPFHLLTNAWVFRDREVVRSVSKWLTVDRDTGLPRSGDYLDRWVATTAGWRIAERVARVRWTGGAWVEGYGR